MRKSRVRGHFIVPLARALTMGVLAQCGGAQRPAIPPTDCTATQTVHLVVDGSDRLNLDDHGRSLPTIVRIYQLKNVTRLENAEFEDVWLRARETLGDDLVDSAEVTIYPNQRATRSFQRNPEAMYVAGVAIVRHPAGISWRTIYELGPAPGAARCAARQRDPAANPPPPPDPRFYFLVEDYRIEGGQEPPDMPDAGAPRAQDDGGTRGPSMPSIPSAPQMPSVPSAPQMPSVPSAPQMPSAPPGVPLSMRAIERDATHALLRASARDDGSADV